jgi:hypothetical protein
MVAPLSGLTGRLGSSVPELPSLQRTVVALLLTLGGLAPGLQAARAQQADPDGSGPPALKQRVPAPQQGARGLSYYLRHPNAPIPPAVKQRMPDRMLKQIRQRRERRREGKGGMNARRRAPVLKDIGGFPEIESEQSWVLNENPNPSLNFDLTGTPQFAGDVNGDGTNDYLYADGFARDERTPELEDQTGKTALFYGGSPSETEDQLVYAELRPAGDLNGDGFDDALQIDGTTARIWGGSQNGYVDSGVTVDLPSSLDGPFRNDVAGFTDLDGDDFADALLFNSVERRFAVLYGADTFGGVAIQTYRPSTDALDFTYNVADLDGNGQGSIVRLEGDNFGGGNPMRVRIFDFEEGGSEIFFKDFQGDQLSPMTVYNVSDGNGWRIGSFAGNSFAKANAFGGSEASNSWLITPALNFNDFEGETLTFRNAKAFNDEGLDQSLRVKVSTDYDGSGNPENSEWTDITDRVENFSEGDFNYVSSGEIGLNDSAFQTDEVHVAFQYQSSGTGAGSSEEWQVDDVRVVGQDDQTLTRSLTEVQSFAAEELQGSARDNQLSLIDITGNDTLEIASTQGFGAETYVFGRDTDTTYAETPNSLAKDDAVPVGDLDGDGRHDFYTFEDSTDTRYVSYGPSDLSEGLTFDTEIPYGEDVFGAAGFLPEGGLGDVTGDGRPDVGLGLTADPNETVGRRFFSVNSDRTGRSPEDVIYPRGHFFDWIPQVQEIGDFNGDGVTDFAMVRYSLQQIEVFYGGSPISAEPDLTLESPIDKRYFTIASGDFNGDGTTDIAASYVGGDRIEIYLGGAGTQVDHVIDPGNLSGFGALRYPHAIGDVNNDGVGDLIASDPFSGDSQNIAVFFGGTTLPDTPDETIQYESGRVAGRSAAAPGDINGDGADDFVVGRPNFQGEGPGDGRADVYFGGSNPSFSSPDLALRLNTDVGSFSSGLAGGDFNGDGYGDVAVRPSFGFSEENVQVSVFLGGPGMDGQVDRTLPTPAASGLGDDFNDDGLTDRISGPLEVVGDVDGNGADELVQASYSNGTNALLYRLTADSSVTRVFRAPNQDEGMGYFGGLGSVAAGDFTDDGTRDVVFSQTFDNNDANLSSRVYRYPIDLATSPPPAPAEVRAVPAAQENEIRLTWNVVGAGSLDGYHVYRSTAPFTDPKASEVTRLTGLPISDTSYVDSGLEDGTTYHYRVTAVDTDGNEGPVSVDGKEAIEGLAASVSASVDSSGTYDFGETGLDLSFEGVDGSGTVTVERYLGEPTDADGIDLSNVSAVRFVVDGGGVSFDSSEVRLPVSELTGVGAPSNVTVYSRPSAGTGTFDSLKTTVGTAGTPGDISDDTLYATTGSFSEFALASDSEPLPVELASFEARTDGDKVRLSWQTASETGNARFEIQRRVASTSGVRRAGEGTKRGEGSWSRVGSVEGAGTTTEAKSYRFADTDLPYRGDRLEYRLKQVDTDGSAHLSKTVTVERPVEKVQLLSTYPNPASRRATVRYALPEKQKASIRLYDALGRQVRTVLNEEQAGRHQQTLDVDGLPSGVYFLRLRADGQTRTQKLTVVR